MIVSLAVKSFSFLIDSHKYTSVIKWFCSLSSLTCNISLLNSPLGPIVILKSSIDSLFILNTIISRVSFI